MSTYSMIRTVRAAVLATLLVAPAVAFAADDTAVQPSAATPSRQQQAQLPGSTAAAPAINGRDTSGDDPYAAAIDRHDARWGAQSQKGFSNEPDWNGIEYRGSGL
jgi:hypothetical protein